MSDRPKWIGGWRLIRGQWRRPFWYETYQDSRRPDLSVNDLAWPLIDAPHGITWIAWGCVQAWAHGPSVEEAA